MSSRGRFGAVCLAAAAIAAGAACLSKASLPERRYSIDPPPARTGPSPASGVVLALERVRVEPPYSGQSFVYRTAGHGVERDPYASFASPPAWLLTAAIHGYLANADFVRDVVQQGVGVPFAADVEVVATELAGDLREAAPAAVLTLRFRVIGAAPAGGAAIEILLKTYSHGAPLSERTAQAVIAGWNQDLAAIMGEFESDLKAALASAPAAAERGPK